MQAATSQELVVNPLARAGIGRRDAEPVRIQLDVPIRGRGRMRSTIDRPGDPIFDVLLAMFGGTGSPVDLNPDQVVRLRELGVLITPEEISRDVTLFSPLSTSETEVAAEDIADYRLRGEAWIQDGEAPPAPFADFPMDGLSTRRPIVWHRIGKDHPVAVWWPDATCLSALQRLGRGERLDPAHRLAVPPLVRQGLIVRGSGAGAAPDCETSRGMFAARAMTELNPCLAPGFVDSAAAYYHALEHEGLLPRGDAQSDRYNLHNDPVARFIQRSLQPMIARLAERTVKCSYTYLSWYCGGAELGVHTDRPQCQYSVTLLLDYLPAPAGKSPWPLRIVPREGGAPVEFRQARGEAIFYRGTELPHSRAALPPDHTSMSVLLHYVDEDFTGSLD